MAALEILEHCHHVLFDDLVIIFDLRSADRKALVTMVTVLLEAYRHTDVSQYYPPL